MCSKEGLLILEKLFGGKWYYQKAKQPRRAKYKWMIFNKNAYYALKELEPYLYVKKQHANVCMKGNWDKFIGGKKLTDEETKIRETIHKEMTQLNKRGYFGEEN